MRPKSPVESTRPTGLAPKMIGLGFRLLGTPDGLTDVAKQKYASGFRRSSVGFLVWELRHSFRFGLKKTTVNPSEFCMTAAHADYILDRIVKVDPVKTNTNSLLVVKDLRGRLKGSLKPPLKGTETELTKLQTRIDEHLRSQMGELLPEAEAQLNERSHEAVEVLEPVMIEAVDLKTRFELEGRSGTDSLVVGMVHNSLHDHIETRLSQYDRKRSTLNSDETFTAVLNLYQALDSKDLTPFLVSETLRNVELYGALMHTRSVIHLGVACSSEDFNLVRKTIENMFQYTLIGTGAPFNQIKANHKMGFVLHIWRYELDGIYNVTRNQSQTFWFSRFTFAKKMFRNFLFRIPEDYDLYLTELYGRDWRVPKLHNYTTFDFSNNSYNQTPEALIGLTNRLITALRKNHRRPATRAIQDLNDYFGLDYMAFIPIEGYQVDTPAERRRIREGISSEKFGYASIYPQNPISAAQINELLVSLRKADKTHLAVFVSDNIPSSDVLLALNGVYSLEQISTLSEWQTWLQEHGITEDSVNAVGYEGTACHTIFNVADLDLTIEDKESPQASNEMDHLTADDINAFTEGGRSTNAIQSSRAVS